ncbi:MAG: SMC-Scp complex subunit ScpB [Bacteroidetes bacterium]|nr:SMC-Scp complex subunit ScpB [Bacteroidota bacterium]
MDDTQVPQTGADRTDDLFLPDDVLLPVVEGLIFASETPLGIPAIRALLDEEFEQPGAITDGRIAEAIDRLNKDYEQQNRVFFIQAIADGYCFMTREAFAPWVSKLYRNKQVKRINQSALETLSIIAYKQPISKPDIENIRRSNSDYAVKILLERNLITVVGRGETVGKPLLYGTTREFLMHFGLKSIRELPKLREISEIMKDDDFEFEQQMRIRMDSPDGESAPESTPEDMNEDTQA